MSVRGRKGWFCCRLALCRKCAAAHAASLNINSNSGADDVSFPTTDGAERATFSRLVQRSYSPPLGFILGVHAAKLRLASISSHINYVGNQISNTRKTIVAGRRQPVSQVLYARFNAPITLKLTASNLADNVFSTMGGRRVVYFLADAIGIGPSKNTIGSQVFRISNFLHSFGLVSVRSLGREQQNTKEMAACALKNGTSYQ